MEINHLIEFVTGPFETETGELICVGSPKYGTVELCFKEGMNIPFAKIKLHSRDRAVDAKAVFDDAMNLGKEIARRWNANRPIHMKPRLDTLKAMLIDKLVLDDTTPICETTHLYEDLGADSLDVVDLIMHMEDQFDISISDDAASGIQTVAELLRILNDHLGPETA